MILFQAHQSLERKVSDLHIIERLEKLERKFDMVTQHSASPTVYVKPEPHDPVIVVKGDDSVRQQVIELEQEKLRLRKELQQERANREEAEENTQK